MFCPRCGQQAAEEVRFCSRCGLPLGAAAEIVEAGGNPAWMAAHEEGAGALTPRQRGTRKGLMILAGGSVFLVVAALLTAFRDELFPFLIIAGVVLTIGVMRLLYALMLEEHRSAKKTSKQATVKVQDAAAELKRGAAHGGELPPARAVPAALYTRPSAHTADMAAPQSVTENTTKLLDENEERGARRH
jgi:hypothetical protein